MNIKTTAMLTLYALTAPPLYVLTAPPLYVLTAPLPVQAAEPAAKSITEDPAVTFNRCVQTLESQGVIFTRLEEFTTGKGCKIADPVTITAIRQPGRSIDFPAKPVLSCQYAARLATWLSDVAAPIAHNFAKSALKAISSGPGFVCRNRYNRKNGKISEHALGNAIDINGFVFADGRRIAVSKSTTGTEAERRMLMALRISSCGYFTTVLGPGANPAHKDHFHLDFGKHGRTWNYRICE